MPFGQLVIGPPGSGKTTYCNGMDQFYSLLKRDHATINLDPANENIPYQAAVDVRDLISVEEVMKTFNLGPNGAMLYCIEYLEKNLDWLWERLGELKDKYLIFDCPGQVELYTHHESMKRIVDAFLAKDYRLCVVNLIDAHYCTDASKYISVLLLSLNAMLQLGMPHVNVLSKVDLMESYGKLAFDLEYYTEVQDLHQLLPLLNQDARMKKFTKLNEALIDLIDNFNLIGFYPLYVEDRDCVLNIARAIDKANGFVFGGLDTNDTIHGAANRVGALEDVSWIAEKYLGRGLEEESDEMDDLDEVDIPDEVLAQQWKEEIMAEHKEPKKTKRSVVFLDEPPT